MNAKNTAATEEIIRGHIPVIELSLRCTYDSLQPDLGSGGAQQVPLERKRLANRAKA